MFTSKLNWSTRFKMIVYYIECNLVPQGCFFCGRHAGSLPTSSPSPYLGAAIPAWVIHSLPLAAISGWLGREGDEIVGFWQLFCFLEARGWCWLGRSCPWVGRDMLGDGRMPRNCRGKKSLVKWRADFQAVSPSSLSCCFPNQASTLYSYD